MKIQDTRRVRLAQLIAERYKSQADFVALTGESQSEVSGLLKTKSFGEKKARKLEEKCGLPTGWLDEAGEDDVTHGGEGRTRQVISGTSNGPEWMSAEAYQLLTLYYAADQDGRAEIMNTAIDFGGVARERAANN